MAKTNGSRTIRKIGIISSVIASTLGVVVIYTSVVLFAGEQSREIEKVNGRVDVIEKELEVRFVIIDKRFDRQEKKLDHIIELLAGKDK